MTYLEKTFEAIDRESIDSTCTLDLLKIAIENAYYAGKDDGYQEGYGDGFEADES